MHICEYFDLFELPIQNTDLYFYLTNPLKKNI